ncbi:hypothetical protein ABIB58_002936 [Brevundimonas sp. UYEF29]|uniref:AAA family ATPase n=1 Tax=Brevundimonas sp. UYEF29 TaxID=3156346 RepID=UPI003392A0F4
MKTGVWRTLAGGLTCVSLTVIGQALSQDGAAGAAAAAGGLVAGPVGAAVGGLAAKALGNFLGDSGGDLIMTGGREALSSWLSRGGPKPGELPLNHDLARAIRLSQLDALDFIVTQHAQAHGAARFARRVRDWTDAGRREAAAADFLETPDDGTLLTDLAAVLEDIGARLPAPGAVPAMAEDAMLAELRAAGEARGWPIDRPDAFERRFRGEAAHAGWLAATNAFFAARLKEEKAVALRAAFELDQFRGLNLQLTGIQRTLVAGDTAIQARLDAIDAALRDIGAAQADAPDVGRLAARGESVSEIAAELQRLLATSPRWSRTAAAVRLRQARLLARPIFGREEAFSALDAFLCDRPGGLLILTGAAGAGKSALLAHWLESAAPTNAVRHFISADLPATTSPDAIEGHIAAQLDSLVATASAIPAADQPAGERIYQRLAAFTPSATTGRVVIVLDGLDEAAARIEPFIPAPLPEGVFVIIGCRAASDRDSPRVLRPWLDLLEAAPEAGARLHLSGLSLPGVSQWLTEVAPLMPQEARDRLAGGLHRNLEGLPLFLSEVFSTLPPAADGSAPVAAPDNFGAYVRARLAELEDAGDLWALSNRRLFALLGLAHAPLRQWEIEDLFAVMAGGLSIELNSLDPRIARWFVTRGEGSERTFAFHHPRLAAAFSEQLGTDADVAAETLTLWLAQAWRPRPRRPGAPYALDWSPRQLCELAAPDAAVRLLTDSAFLAARFERHETALDRARRTIEDWRRLAADGHEGAGRPHAAFWALHGERLKQAWRPVAAARTPYGRVVLNALADAGLFGAEPGRAVIAHPPARSVLTRAALHPGLVEAISGHGLIMSGGRRGDVLFWDKEGRVRGEPDGPIRHSGEVRRLVVLADGFASIGEDGRVLFWTGEGRSRHDRLPQRVHADASLGACPLPDGGLVTHDVDGAVIFWDSEGRERAREIFGGPVRQAVVAHGRVFLTSDDGHCALREITGAPAGPLGPSVLAQAPGAASAAALPDGFVSWSFNSPPIFWSRDGRPRPAAGSAGLSPGLREGLAHPDGLAGRTPDHRLAFWRLQGAALEEACADPAAARVGPPCANGDRLLVVDAAGAAEVRDFRGRLIGRTPALGFEDNAGVWPVTGGWLIAGFWGGASAFVSLEGRVLSVPEVCPRVTACLARPRLTLTGDLEGRIRLWSTAGDLLSHPFPPELHASASNGVRGLLEVEDRLVSYGDDGLLKFWRVSALNGAFDLIEPDLFDGATSHGTAGPEGAVSWDHYGRLLFWSADGAPIGEVLLETAVAEAVWLGEVVIVLERDNRVHVFTRAGERLAQDDALMGREAGVYAGRLTPFPGGCAATGAQALLLIDLKGQIRMRDADVWGDASPIRDVAAVEGGVVLVNPAGAPALSRFDGLRAGTVPPGAEAGFPDLTVSGRDVAITLGSSLRIWAMDDIDGPPRIIRSTPGALLGAAGLSPGFATFERSGGVAFWSADGGMRARRYPFAGGARPARWVSGDGRLYVADAEGALTVWDGEGTLVGEHRRPDELICLTPAADGLAAGDPASGLHWFTDSADGPATSACSVHAHAGDLAVTPLSDGRLLSWAPGDIIHIWSGPGELDDTLVVPDEIRHVECVADGVYVFGSRLWRFRWNEADAPPPPSDAPGW